MRIGVQTYTIRDFTKNEQDFAVSMKKVADIGYKYVQISGIGDIPAKQVADICKSNGLEIVLTHTPPQKLLNETEQVIENHKIMGADYVGLGAMPESYRENGETVKKFIDDFLPVAEKFKNAGLKFMYHNHAFEFERFDNKLIYEHLIDSFDKDLMGFVLDTYWIQVGGGDPALWLRKLAGRLDTIHFKDAIILKGKPAMGEVLEGNLNWDAIFKECEPSGVKWAFVEQDNCNGRDPFESLKISFDNLAKYGYN